MFNFSYKNLLILKIKIILINNIFYLFFYVKNKKLQKFNKKTRFFLIKSCFLINFPISNQQLLACQHHILLYNSYVLSKFFLFHSPIFCF